MRTQGPVKTSKESKKECPDDCFSVKFSDGCCDELCNTVACLWDGNDCDGVTPKGGERDHRVGQGNLNF